MYGTCEIPDLRIHRFSIKTCVNIRDDVWDVPVEISRSGRSLKWRISIWKVLCWKIIWCVRVCIPNHCCCWGDGFLHLFFFLSPQWFYWDSFGALLCKLHTPRRSLNLSTPCTLMHFTDSLRWQFIKVCNDCRMKSSSLTFMSYQFYLKYVQMR